MATRVLPFAPTERRRLAPKPKPPAGSALSRDDLDALRHATATARHLLHLVMEDSAGRKEVLRSAYVLADLLGEWHRRAEPRLYGRGRGFRP